MNIYKLSVIFSSSAANVVTCDSFALPFILVLYFFISENEFNNIDKKSLYISVNLTSIIVIIFCCVLFNEIILFFCQDDKSYSNSIIDAINNKINDLFVIQNLLDGSFTTEGKETF